MDSSNEKTGGKREETVLSPGTSTEEEAGSREIDHVAEQKLIRKLDRHIIPIVMLFVNVGNARLYGMEDDLDLKGDQFQIALSLLFVTYCLSEIPSNLVLKKFTPSRWIAFITVSWGIIATLTGLTRNYASFIACRLLLGAVEGGLFPGLTIYLTIFYTKHEIALRLGYLFASAAIAGAVGGLLSYGIGFMDGVSGQRGWRWILILEGLPTILLGISTWFLLADDPEHAPYLSDQEKEILSARRNRQIGQTASARELHKADVYLALKDWKIWAFAAGQFCADTVLYGYSIFLPTIIKGFGNWSTAEIQALTVPCYSVGALTYFIAAKVSDSQQRRGVYAASFGLVSVIGYGLLISKTGSGVHYFGCFLVAMGLYVNAGLPLAWLSINQPRYGKRVTANGLQLTIGNSSGAMAPFLYKTFESPRYIRGHAVTMSLVAVSSLIWGFMSWFLARLNKARREGKEDAKIENMSDEEIKELGDASPRFIYTI